MEHRSRVVQDATYTKHVYQHRKDYVEWGLVSLGNNVAESKKERKCGLLIVVVLYK